KTIPMRLRISVTGTFFEYKSKSSSFNEPVMLAYGKRSCIRLKLLNKVLLPQPDGPINAVISFSLNDIFTSFRTCLVPKLIFRFCADNLVFIFSEFITYIKSCKVHKEHYNNQY